MMIIDKINNNLASHYFVVRRDNTENSPYFSLFVSGKPSWSKFLWMARRHDTKKDAEKTIDWIRYYRRILRKSKRTTTASELTPCND